MLDLADNVKAEPLAVSQETAARMLEVTSQTIRNWEIEGLIAPTFIGKKKLKRFRVADLRKLAGCKED